VIMANVLLVCMVFSKINQKLQDDFGRDAAMP
jgi:hypothetical protein